MSARQSNSEQRAADRLFINSVRFFSYNYEGD
jgi:hypothetical protein